MGRSLGLACAQVSCRRLQHRGHRRTIAPPEQPRMCEPVVPNLLAEATARRRCCISSAPSCLSRSWSFCTSSPFSPRCLADSVGRWEHSCPRSHHQARIRAQPISLMWRARGATKDRKCSCPGILIDGRGSNGGGRRNRIGGWRPLCGPAHACPCANGRQAYLPRQLHT